MFNDIPSLIAERMAALEKIDKADRDDGTLKRQRLRQVPRETGKFLSLMLSMSPPGNAIEIGTSAGYSTLWLALAVRDQGRKVITFETDGDKVRMAKETFQAAGVDDIVEVIHGDAAGYVEKISDVTFCFLDCDKEYYLKYYEAVIPILKHGGLLIADNVISHTQELSVFIQRAACDKRVDALIVPIGTGELVCRKI